MLVLSSLSSCSSNERIDLVLSEQFNVCIDAPRNSTAEIEKPVDVEFVSARVGDYSVRYVFDNYPRRKDISEEVENDSPGISRNLNIHLIERRTDDGNEYAYVRFDQKEGSKYPFAYAEVTSSSYLEKDFLDFVKMMRRCQAHSL